MGSNLLWNVVVAIYQLTLRSLYNHNVLYKCQQIMFMFSAIVPVRKGSLHNTHLQNKRSNLILTLILLRMKILQVKKAVVLEISI